MRRTRNLCWMFGLPSIFALASLGTPQESTRANQIDDRNHPIEVLTRGPVHEAYAQPLEQQPEPGTPVPKGPPAPIPEEPPPQGPDLDNAQWIPGYWAWDAERNDFIWVSGVYRVAPQGRTFVPGYWTQTPNGWRWIAGFWSDPNQPDMPYAPEPPAPLDNGPSLPPPDDNSMYIPGVWVYRDSRFIWRPGYYSQSLLGRVWVPSHYVWTPNGYLFVNGYWDLPYDARGLVCAPVYFNRPLWADAGWCYRPNFVVGYDAFFDSAFIRAGSCHFYFGNFYGDRCARLGYNPWYTGRGRYDPAFSYYGLQNYRNNPNWIAGIQQTYAGRAGGRLAAPPISLAQQTALVNARSAPAVVTPANQFTSKQVRLVNATPTQLDTQKAAAQRNRQIAANRQQFDAAPSKSSNTKNNVRAAEVRALQLPTILQAPTIPQASRLSGNPSPRPSETKTFPLTKGNPAAKSVTPTDTVTQPKPTTQPKAFSQPQSKAFTPPPQPQPQPKAFTPPPKPQPQPKAFTPPPQPQPQPKAFTPAPQPQPQPKAFTPPPAPKAISQPPPPPRVSSPPPPAPRVSSPPPHVQSPPSSVPPQRVSSPPPRSNPPPAPKSSPPSGGKTR